MYKHKVMFFTKEENEFSNVITKLQGEGISVVINSDNIIENIMEILPKVIIIDSEQSFNSMVLLKSINDDGSINMIPIIVIGPEKDDTKVNTLLMGAIDYITKPFNEDELFYKVRNIVNISKGILKNNIYDHLTGVYLRNHGKEMAQKQLELVKASGGKFNILTVDIDDMVKVNLEKGEEIGSKILKDFADICITYQNEGDFIYRNHGDNFVMVLLGKDTDEVMELVKKLQESVRELSKEYGVSISFSGGVSYLKDQSDSFYKIYTEASDNLKVAKRTGKGKIYAKADTVLSYDKKKLLFIDDEKIILSILSTRYKNKGYEVYSMEDPREAVEFLKKTPIDIIITDFYMPTMQGDELIKEVRKMNKDIKIIVLSGQKSEELMEMLWGLGVNEYITKPFSPVDLDLRIRKLIEQR